MSCDQMNNRCDQMNNRCDQMNNRCDQMNNRCDQMNNRWSRWFSRYENTDRWRESSLHSLHENTDAHLLSFLCCSCCCCCCCCCVFSTCSFLLSYEGPGPLIVTSVLLFLSSQGPIYVLTLADALFSMCYLIHTSCSPAAVTPLRRVIITLPSLKYRWVDDQLTNTSTSSSSQGHGRLGYTLG